MSAAPAWATAAALAAGAVASARLLLSTVTVRGGSMTPALLHGDVLLVLRHRRRARPGRIVVVQRPDRRTGWTGPADPSGAGGWYVKRVVAAAGDPVPDWVAGERPGRVPPGMLVLRGDHPRSEDSRQWGLCPADRMYGVVLTRLRAAGGHTAV
ncbi:putative phage repressor [Streptomyces bingchenggensis BCW-1]|uniref:Putative phage repressor n=1 Tax=Streptomyces bingchenggensis (strain BCW-1) TaxID=749414 RepID=D7C804_STRBB|nr:MULTISPECIES: S26 family signal peptidase [Streptomyces]ADI04165.1 putative phage repressor [Streptomyces bingchenggensis BCW-1]